MHRYLSVVSVECCQSSVRPADHSSGGVLQTVVCPMSVIAKPRTGKPRPGIRSKSHRRRKKTIRGLRNPRYQKFYGVWLRQLRICTLRQPTAFILADVFNGAVTTNKHTTRCDCIIIYYTTIEGQQCLQS